MVKNLVEKTIVRGNRSYTKKTTNDDKLIVLSRMIEDRKNEELKGIDIDLIDNEIWYLVRRSCVYQGYPVGHWIQALREGSKKEESFREIVEKELKIYLGPLKSHKTVDERIQIVQEAIANNAPGIKINEDGKIKIDTKCEYKDCKIGQMIHNIEMGKTIDSNLIQGLKDLGVLIRDVISYEDQYEAIKEAVEKMAPGVSIVDEKYEIDMNCEYVYQGVVVPIGAIIYHLQYNVRDGKFKSRVAGLNINVEKPKRNLTVKEKLSLIEEAIKAKEEGREEAKAIKISYDGKYIIPSNFIFQNKDLRVMIVDTKDEEFVKGLEDLNVIIQTKRKTPEGEVEKFKYVINRAREEGLDGVTFYNNGERERIVIDPKCQYVETVIRSILNNKCKDKKFVAEIEGLGVVVSGREYKTIKTLMLIEAMIKAKDKSIITLPNGKYKIDDYDLNNIIVRINKGELKDSIVINKLIELNIDIDQEIIDKYTGVKNDI